MLNLYYGYDYLQVPPSIVISVLESPNRLTLELATMLNLKETPSF